ncbi:MAG TPA: Hpt domain-containing protein, partial [Solirubrobacteraceae bacterium]|nr:Hpt domain-containing protein [Solirubrobacteraceae bacterium]
MEISEYLPMFLAEGREHLQELNLAVVRIEERPDDQETVDEIFRIAHSLKGMSATMGFAGMAALTHEMEDVFELLRQRKGGLPRAAIDVLLECLDALSAAVDAIDESGEEQIEPKPLISRLKGLIRERDAEEPEVKEAAEAPIDLAELADGRRVVQVSATLSEDVQIPSVRAYMVLAALAELGETLACVPGPDDVETFKGTEIDAWMVSERADSELAAVVGAVSDVAHVEVFEAVSDAAVETGEEVIEDAPKKAAAAAPKKSSGHGKGAATVRVDAERLDQLMHFMGELVLHRTQVEALAADADVPGLSQAMQNLTRTSHALQAMVMQVRMIPVEAVFLRFPRLVRDLSTKLGKQVELELVGKDTELDRTVVDALGDPLVHLIRNSLDHGLEGPDERVAAGKPGSGTLNLSARHAGGNVVIEVRDDGRGIDPIKVAQKAADKGLIGADAVATTDMAKAIELL